MIPVVSLLVGTASNPGAARRKGQVSLKALVSSPGYPSPSPAARPRLVEAPIADVAADRFAVCLPPPET